MELARSLLLLIGIGAVAGFSAGALSRFRRGCLTDVALGITGSLTAGLVFGHLVEGAVGAIALLYAAHRWKVGGILAVCVVFVVLIIGRQISHIVEADRLAHAGPLEWEDILKEKSSRMNEQLPRMIDDSTRWDLVVAGPGKNVTYLLTLTDARASELSWPKLVGPLRHSLRQGMCRAGPTAEILRAGVTLTFRYSGKDGKTIGHIQISPQDCLPDVVPAERAGGASRVALHLTSSASHSLFESN